MARLAETLARAGARLREAGHPAAEAASGLAAELGASAAPADASPPPDATALVAGALDAADECADLCFALSEEAEDEDEMAFWQRRAEATVTRLSELRGRA